MHALLALPLLLLILSVDAQVSWNITVSTPVRKGSSKTLLLDVCGQASKVME